MALLSDRDEMARSKSNLQEMAMARDGRETAACTGMTMFWQRRAGCSSCCRDPPRSPSASTEPPPLPPQALADDASLILKMKERYDTPGSPVVALGGSLAGAPALHLLPC